MQKRYRTRWLLKKALALCSLVCGRRHSLSVTMKNPHRIACFINGGIGDGVMAWPMLHFIRYHFPCACIDIFVPPRAYPLLSLVYSGFQVYPFTFAMVLRRIKSGRYAFGITNSIAAFSLAIEWASVFLCRRSYGFRYPDEKEYNRAYSNTRPMLPTTHDIDQNLQCAADACGCAYSDADRNYPSWPGKTIITNKIVIHPGSEKGYGYKQWPLERYFQIIERALESSYSVDIILGPAEKNYRIICNEFVSAQGQKQNKGIVRVLSDLTPTAFCDTLGKASLFIGTDSGPAHCASFFGTPALCLMGPTDPSRTAPHGKQCRFITKSLPCSPCHFTQRSCDDQKCLNALSVDEVWEVMTDMLSPVSEKELCV